MVSTAKFYFVAKKKQDAQINREKYSRCDAEHEKRMKMQCGVHEQQDHSGGNQRRQDLL